jgi:hypothetical protein
MNNPTDNEVILQLVAELHLELEWWRSHAQLATKQDLTALEIKIMATVQSVVAQFQASVDDLKTAQAEFKTDLQQVADADTALLAKLVDLQKQLDAINAGGGTVGAADQPAIDKLQADLAQAVSDAKAGNAATLALVPALPAPPPVPAP